MKKVIKIVLLLLLAPIILFYNYIDNVSLIKYNSAFVSISLTIATFSISFSFLQYQFSPYKVILRSISVRQLGFSYLAILLSLLPLFTLYFDEELVPLVGLFCIPILSYLIIILVIIANEEINPIIFLKHRLSEDKIKRFIKNFHSDDKKRIKEVKNLDFSKPDETPMHDYGESSYKLIDTKDNPFLLIYKTISVSTQNNDIDIFESSINYFFQTVDKTIATQLIEKYELKNRIEKLICNSFDKICSQICYNSDRKDFQNILIGSFSIYIKKKAVDNNHTDNVSRKFISIISSKINALLEQDNYDDALIIISLLRQLGQKGLYDVNQNDFFFNHNINLYPTLIKNAGQKAIQLKNSDFIFRCLEEIGYLGCSAIKLDNHIVGVKCLEFLVQLGRESRANKLKCFWENCALDPIDHADERIWWMLTWMLKVNEANRKYWIGSFETAYSRMLGMVRKIEMTEIEGKAVFSFKESDRPHIEQFIKDSYNKTIDYSDFNELKEFRLM